MDLRPAIDDDRDLLPGLVDGELVGGRQCASILSEEGGEAVNSHLRGGDGLPCWMSAWKARPGVESARVPLT